MTNWSTSWVRSSGVVMLAIASAACPARPLEPLDDTPPQQPWAPCGQQTVVEHTAEDSAAMVLPNWTVAEVVALISDVSYSLEWGVWDSDYLGAPPPTAQTQISLFVATDAATITGYEHSVQDDFCSDWIEVSIPIDLQTADGQLAGPAQALITMTPDLGETTVEISTPLQDLGVTAAWPSSESRPEPDATFIRIELGSPTLGLNPQFGGVLELVRTWSSPDDWSQAAEVLGLLG